MFYEIWFTGRDPVFNFAKDIGYDPEKVFWRLQLLNRIKESKKISIETLINNVVKDVNNDVNIDDSVVYFTNDAV